MSLLIKRLGNGFWGALDLIDPSTPFLVDDNQYTTAIELSGSSPIYVGEALPGTAKSAAGWRIKKLTYSGTDVTDVQWADSTAGFTKTWDNRATYTYA